MADSPRLPSPRLTVVMDDGATFEVQSDNRDQLAYERTRARHKWPEPSAAPFMWLTFLAWSALRREGAYPGNLDEFEAHALGVTNQTDGEEDVPSETPTQSAAGAD